MCVLGDGGGGAGEGAVYWPRVGEEAFGNTWLYNFFGLN